MSLPVRVACNDVSTVRMVSPQVSESDISVTSVQDASEPEDLSLPRKRKSEEMELEGDAATGYVEKEVSKQEHPEFCSFF